MGACTAADSVLLATSAGMVTRFHTDDAELRPRSRIAGGIAAMRLRPGESLVRAKPALATRPWSRAAPAWPDALLRVSYRLGQVHYVQAAVLGCTPALPARATPCGSHTQRALWCRWA